MPDSSAVILKRKKRKMISSSFWKWAVLACLHVHTSIAVYLLAALCSSWDKDYRCSSK